MSAEIVLAFEWPLERWPERQISSRRLEHLVGARENEAEWWRRTDHARLLQLQELTLGWPRARASLTAKSLQPRSRIP